MVVGEPVAVCEDAVPSFFIDSSPWIARNGLPVGFTVADSRVFGPALPPEVSAGAYSGGAVERLPLSQNTVVL